MDLISIVVPVYNVQDYLEECINSLINQSYQNIEILLIDDGSTDKSPIICDNFLKIDSRIKTYHKKNGGLSDARNYGIKQSKGNYVFFIDSDDVIQLNTLEILYEIIKKSDSDISCVGFNNFTDKIPDVKTNNKYEEFTASEGINEMLYQRKINNSACGKLLKKELFNQILFPIDMYFEDLATTYKLLLKSEKVCVSCNDLYFYRQRRGSIMHSINEKRTDDLIKIIDEMEKILYKEKFKKALRCRIINSYFYIHRNTNNMQKKQKAKEYIKRNRIGVLFNYSSFKTKIGIMISFVSMGLVDCLFKIINGR